MDYSPNQAYAAKEAYYHQQNAIAGAGATLGKIEPPRTIASAASRIDELNQRLSVSTEALGMIAAQLGALSGVGVPPLKDQTAASGAIHRLNDAADAAHLKLGEMEGLIAGISRALG